MSAEEELLSRAYQAYNGQDVDGLPLDRIRLRNFLTTQSLRHTGLTWMADAGVPLHVLRKIAGLGSLNGIPALLAGFEEDLAEDVQRHAVVDSLLSGAGEGVLVDDAGGELVDVRDVDAGELLGFEERAPGLVIPR